MSYPPVVAGVIAPCLKITAAVLLLATIATSPALLNPVPAPIPIPVLELVFSPGASINEVYIQSDATLGEFCVASLGSP